MRLTKDIDSALKGFGRAVRDCEAHRPQVPEAARDKLSGLQDQIIAVMTLTSGLREQLASQEFQPPKRRKKRPRKDKAT